MSPEFVEVFLSTGTIELLYSKIRSIRPQGGENYLWQGKRQDPRLRYWANRQARRENSKTGTSPLIRQRKVGRSRSLRRLRNQKAIKRKSIGRYGEGHHPSCCGTKSLECDKSRRGGGNAPAQFPGDGEKVRVESHRRLTVASGGDKEPRPYILLSLANVDTHGHSPWHSFQSTSYP